MTVKTQQEKNFIQKIIYKPVAEKQSAELLRRMNLQGPADEITCL